MAFQHGSWRSLALPALLALLAMACGGGSDSKASSTTTETITLSGTVSFYKPPVLKDAVGRPTGLDFASDKQVKQPARGVAVRVLKAKEETQADGSKATLWVTAGQVVTGADGKYTVSVDKGERYCLELTSLWTGGSASSVRLVADPNGLASTLPLLERVHYALRKAPDGTAPDGVAVPSAKADANATVDFDVKADTRWWIASPRDQDASSATLESTGTGARVLNVLDSLQSFNDAYGDPGMGLTLQLHYRPGLGGRSFVEYDRSQDRLALASGQYVGAIRGLAGNDDAWDDALLYTLWARNAQVRQGYAPILPFQARPQGDPDFGADQVALCPDLALAMGLPELMAANLLKSPYLPDFTAGGAVASVRDLRELGALPKDYRCAPALAQLGWTLLRHANGTLAGSTVTPLPDEAGANGWDKLDPKAFRRFFPSVLVPATASAKDLVTLYDLLDRLKAAKTTTDSVDLAALFKDDLIKSLAAPYGITWPRPTTGTDAIAFRTDWGKDPDSAVKALPPFTLSMADAKALADGSFANATAKEFFFGTFTLSADPDYYVNLSPLPAAGTAVEVKLGTEILRFDDKTPSDPFDLSKNVKSLRGNANLPSVPVQVRLLSPSAKAADQSFTLSLTRLPH